MENLQDSDNVLFELSERHNMATTCSKQTPVSKEILPILTSTYHVLLVLLLSSDTCMLHVQTCIYSLPPMVITIAYVTYNVFSCLRTRHPWHVEDH